MNSNDLSQSANSSTNTNRLSPFLVLGILLTCCIIVISAFCIGVVLIGRNPSLLSFLSGPEEDIVAEVSSDPNWVLSIEDDFVSNIYGWDIGPTEQDTVKLEQTMGDGKFTWDFQAISSWHFWNWPDTENFDDFVVAVELQHTAGARTDSYGIAFRISEENLYYFEVNDSGQYGVWLLYQDEYKILLSGNRAYLVKPGKINQLAVKSVGSRYAFYINQQLVGEIEDNALSNGKVGIILSPTGMFQTSTGSNNNSQGELAWQRSTFEIDNFKIWVPINSEQAATKRLILLDPQPGRLVYMSSTGENSEIYTSDTNGKNQVNLTNNPADDYDPEWSPDGKQIIFVSERDGNAEIYLMNRDGSDITRLTDSPRYDVDPSWSPDGNKVVFISNRDGGYNLWLMDIKTKSIEVLTHVSFAAFPDWSPDGSSIIYQVSERKKIYLSVFDVKTREEKRIELNSANSAARPVWSPDGLSYMYENVVSYQDQVGISIRNFLNEQFESVLEPVGVNIWPTWSPDGKQIAFTSYRGGQRDIYIISRDGKSIYRVTDDDRIEGMIDWFAE